MHKPGRETTHSSTSLRRRERRPSDAPLVITGDARTDRGLITLVSLISEIAAEMRVPAPGLTSETLGEEPSRQDGETAGCSR
jgi:hypothetical protein